MSYSLVKLIDPQMCEGCRFNRRAVVVEDGREVERMYCTIYAGWCDNHEVVRGAEKVEFVKVTQERDR